MILRDGELFAHLPGATGLQVADGELYGVLGKASRVIKELSGSCEAAATATGIAMRHSFSAGAATGDAVAISALSRQRLAEGIAAIVAEGAGAATRQRAVSGTAVLEAAATGQSVAVRLAQGAATGQADGAGLASRHRALAGHTEAVVALSATTRRARTVSGECLPTI